MTFVMYVKLTTRCDFPWPINQTNDTESTKLKAEIEKLKTEQTNSNKVIIGGFSPINPKTILRNKKKLAENFRYAVYKYITTM